MRKVYHIRAYKGKLEFPLPLLGFICSFPIKINDQNTSRLLGRSSASTLLDGRIETSPDYVPGASEQSLLLQSNKAASSDRRSCKTAISCCPVLGIDLRC